MTDAQILDILNYIRMFSSGFSGFGVLALGYFAWRQGLISFSNIKNSDTTPEWAAQLQQHFNHETTELLRNILDSTKNISDAIRRLDLGCDKSSKKLDQIIMRNELIDKLNKKK